MNLLILVLFLTTSCVTLPDARVCIPSETFGKVYCGIYSFEEVKWRTPPTSSEDSVSDFFCINNEDWLTKLKPKLIERKRYYQDTKE